MKLKEFLGHQFRDRELFIRADGRVRYIRLSRSLQIFCAVLLVSMVAWSVTATLSMRERGAIIASQQVAMSLVERERQRLGGELAATRAYYSNAASEIDRQYRELQRLSSVRGSLEGKLMASQAELARIEAEYFKSSDQSEDLDKQVASLRAQLRQRTAANQLLSQRLAEAGSALAGATAGAQRAISDRQETEFRLSRLQDSLQNTESLNQDVRKKLAFQQVAIDEMAELKDLASTEARRLSSKVTALYSDLDEAYRNNSSLRRRLAATSDALTETHEHQVVAEQRGHHLARTVGALEQRLDQVRATQLELLRGIRAKAQGNIAALKSTLAQTGVPMDELIHATIRRKSGLGGPLVALGDVLENEGEETFEGVVSNLELELLQWESMQTLMSHLPLTRPTKRGYVSSSFGKRRDPITGRKAFHKGVDIAAPNHTPIYATAGGTVTFAGTKAAYGRIVEIDHGFGFVTRYAHLRKILVKKGQRVAFHEEVAKMGSSGRSTGSHVHYEVLFEGEQVDPVNFFEAGRYVFKVQDTSG